MSEQITIDERKGEVVDFQVLKEDWSTYKLSDGTKMKAKIMVTKVVRTDQYDPVTSEPIYVFSSTNHFTTICPKELKGEPTTNQLTPEIIQQSITEALDFESADREEKWNLYNLSDGSVLRVKLELTKISKTSLFEATGDPIYFVNSQNVNRIKVSLHLIKKRSIKVTPTKDIYK